MDGEGGAGSGEGEEDQVDVDGTYKDSPRSHNDFTHRSTRNELREHFASNSSVDLSCLQSVKCLRLCWLFRQFIVTKVARERV